MKEQKETNLRIASALDACEAKEAQDKQYYAGKVWGDETSRGWARECFFNSLEKIFGDCSALVKTKNADYTKLTDDPFYNFRDADVDTFLRSKGELNVDSVVLDLCQRLGEKRKRLLNIVFTGEYLTLDESLEDTLNDSINYHAILLAYLKIHGRLPLNKKMTLEGLQKTNQHLMEHCGILEDRLRDKDSKIASLLEELPNLVKREKVNEPPELTRLSKDANAKGTASKRKHR